MRCLIRPQIGQILIVSTDRRNPGQNPSHGFASSRSVESAALATVFRRAALGTLPESTVEEGAARDSGGAGQFRSYVQERGHFKRILTERRSK